MKKEEKIRVIKSLLKEVKAIRIFDRIRIKQFIDEAVFKIAKVDSPKSEFIKELEEIRISLDVDWKSGIITILNKLLFKVEYNSDKESESTMPALNRQRKVYCNECGIESTHQVKSHFVHSDTHQEPYNGTFLEFRTKRSVEIGMCVNCEEYCIFEEIVDFETHFPGDPEFKVIPLRKDGFLKIPSIPNAPPILIELLKEIINAYNAEALLLCAAGLRAIAEFICNDKGIPKRNGNKKLFLKERINKLIEEGIVTKNNAEVLFKYKFMGDKALHELDKPTAYKIKNAIEIIIHMIQAIYEIDAKAKHLN